MIPKRRPGDHVRIPLSAERNERIWRRIDADLGRPRRPVWIAPVALASLAAALALFAFGLRRPVAPVTVIAREEPRAIDEGVSLPDGSWLRPAKDARTAVLEASGSVIRVKLTQGAASFEVTRDAARSFVVVAGPAEVHADGARFRAELAGDPPLLSLSVEEGAVAVVSPEGKPLASLQAGQVWTLRSVEPVPSALVPVRRPDPPPPPRPTPSAPRTAEPEAPPRAQALFAAADAERLDGHPAEAARQFERLCTAFPGDSRAGIAAFQLARLKLRELGDPVSAARWFRVALDHPSAGAYREDAAADLVESLDRAGRLDECRAAQNAFSAAHPSSLRLAVVSRRCQPR